jgi:hypothetical protein
MVVKSLPKNKPGYIMQDNQLILLVGLEGLEPSAN